MFRFTIFIFSILFSMNGFCDAYQGKKQDQPAKTKIITKKVIKKVPKQQDIKNPQLNSKSINNQTIQLVCPSPINVAEKTTIVKYVPSTSSEVEKSKDKPVETQGKSLQQATRDYFKNLYVGVAVGYGPAGLKRTSIDDEYGRAEVTKDVLFGGRVQFTARQYSTGFTVMNNSSVFADFLIKK